MQSSASGAPNRAVGARIPAVKNTTSTASTTSTTASDAARALSVAATAASQSMSSRDYAALTRSLVKQWQAAHAEKGDRKTSAIDACRVYGASLMTEVLALPNPDGIRSAVSVITKERGKDVASTVTVGIVLILKTLVFGGALIGSSKLVK